MSEDDDQKPNQCHNIDIYIDCIWTVVGLCYPVEWQNVIMIVPYWMSRDAAKYLCELLEPLEEEEHEEWVEKVIEAVQKLPLASSLISREDIHKAAQVSCLSVKKCKNHVLVIEFYLCYCFSIFFHNCDLWFFCLKSVVAIL